MKTIKFFAPVMSALQCRQIIVTRRLFALGLALVGAVLLALPATGQILSDAPTMSFELDGTWFATGREGSVYLGAVTGESTLGPFTGDYRECCGGGEHRRGTLTLVFKHGSFTCDYDYQLVHPTEFWVGTYVVTGGTGSLKGTSGAGMVVIVSGPGTGPWSMSGTLSR